MRLHSIGQWRTRFILRKNALSQYISVRHMSNPTLYSLLCLLASASATCGGGSARAVTTVCHISRVYFSVLYLAPLYRRVVVLSIKRTLESARTWGPIEIERVRDGGTDGGTDRRRGRDGEMERWTYMYLSPSPQMEWRWLERIPSLYVSWVL